MAKNQHIFFLSRKMRLAAIFLLCCGVLACKDLDGNRIHTGWLDLAGVDLSRQRTNLNGPWEFYWKRFLTSDDWKAPAAPVPDLVFHGLEVWTGNSVKNQRLGAEGYGTYRLRVKLPEDTGRLGLRVSQQFTSYRLFVNNRQVAANGQPGKTKEETINNRVDQYVYFTPESTELEIIFHVANYYTFRGGMRGHVQLGQADLIQKTRLRFIAIDLLLMGFVLAIFLYHVLIYLRVRSDKSSIYFILLCFSFLIRMQFFDEKPLILFLEIPFDVTIRIMHGINVISPLLIMLFTGSLFPGSVHRWAIQLYIASIPFYFLTYIFGPTVFTLAMYIYLFTVVSPSAIYMTVIVSKVALRRYPGSLWMAAGIFSSSALLIYTLIAGWQGLQSGIYAIFGFALLVFFQSIAASQVYTDRMLASQRLLAKLRQSEAALAHQRKELEINLHDSLGGNLTDLKILLSRLGQQVGNAGAGIPDSGLLTRLQEKVQATMQNFRAQLLFMEDFELASEEILTGLQMNLLRRYSDAGREVEFAVAPELDSMRDSLNSRIDPEARLNLFLLVQEICTNDLKYGRGESQWSISALPGGVALSQSNQIQEDIDVEPGLIVRRELEAGQRIRDRVRLMGGSCRAFQEGKVMSINIQLAGLFA